MHYIHLQYIHIPFIYHVLFNLSRPKRALPRPPRRPRRGPTTRFELRQSSRPRLTIDDNMIDMMMPTESFKNIKKE